MVRVPFGFALGRRDPTSPMCTRLTLYRGHARSEAARVGRRRACVFFTAPMEQATRTLASGAEMPMLGLGAWQLAEGPETEQAVEWALEAGYRLIDTAAMYRNERGVGAAVRTERPAAREHLRDDEARTAALDAPRQLAKSLERLGLEYVDLYLIHWPLPQATPASGTRSSRFRTNELARDIGVSNFSVARLQKLLRRANRAPAVNQVHFSPFHPQPELLDFCRQKEIVFEAYSPLERGRGVRDPKVVAVAGRLGRTPAQVLLRWAIQHGAVVIPKSSRRERIIENTRVFDSSSQKTTCVSSTRSPSA